MKFSVIRDPKDGTWWLGELNDDESQIRALIGWDGERMNMTWGMQHQTENEYTVDEDHPEFGWCCAQVARLELSRSVTK